MKRLLFAAGSLLLLCTPLHAHSVPYEHAPGGVMMAHVHDAGEWMIGYRVAYETWNGLVKGSDEIGVAEAGYMMVPTSMTMQMHMLDIMYGVTDWLTLAFMPQYMTMDMNMKMYMPMMSPALTGMEPMEVSGVGDTTIAGIFRISESAHNVLLFTLGVSVPTGDAGIRKNGSYLPYGMQLGSGTWDLKPALTYKHNQGRWQFALQFGGTLRLEDRNDAGYQLGNRVRLTSWMAYQVNEWSSASFRLGWKHTGELDGHYDGVMMPMAVGMDTDNYGGTLVNAGVGMNFVIPVGPMKGHRIGIEVVAPLYQDYNGVQLSRDYSIHANWSVSF